MMLIVASSASVITVIVDGLPLAASSVLIGFDRGDILPAAARDPHPALHVAKDEFQAIVRAARNWTVDRPGSLTEDNRGPAIAEALCERPCVAPDLGAATTNAISGDRLPTRVRIETISGALLRASRVSAAAESTVDGRGKVRGRLARVLGSDVEPSLQTALIGRRISGEVVGRSEQFAGIKVPGHTTTNSSGRAVRQKPHARFAPLRGDAERGFHLVPDGPGRSRRTETMRKIARAITHRSQWLRNQTRNTGRKQGPDGRNATSLDTSVRSLGLLERVVVELRRAA